MKGESQWDGLFRFVDLVRVLGSELKLLANSFEERKGVASFLESPEKSVLVQLLLLVGFHCVRRCAKAPPSTRELKARSAQRVADANALVRQNCRRRVAGRIRLSITIEDP